MNCKETRRYINLFLDSELDSKTNFEISEHISICEKCNSRLTQEERIEKSLVSILKEDKDPKTEETWERVISRFNRQVESKEGMHLDFRHLWRYLVPATAALIGIIVMMIVYRGQEPKVLTVAAQKCHREYMTDQIAPSIESKYPDEVSEYFSDKFTFPVNISDIPDSKSHHVKLFGGKVCHLNGVSVAYIMYHCCNAPISVFIISSNDIKSFSDMKRYIESEMMISRCEDGITFMAVQTKQNTIACVVSDHDIELLKWVATNFITS